MSVWGRWYEGDGMKAMVVKTATGRRFPGRAVSLGISGEHTAATSSMVLSGEETTELKITIANHEKLSCSPEGKSGIFPAAPMFLGTLCIIAKSLSRMTSSS